MKINTKTLTVMSIAIMLVATFAASMVLAEDNVTNNTGSTNNTVLASATVDSLDTEINLELDESLNEDVSGTKVGWKKFQLWLTFNKEKKADKELELARYLLIQAKIAAQNGDQAAVDAAMTAHDKLMASIKARVNSIATSTSDIGIKRFNAMEQAIQVHEATVERLQNLIANGNLTEEQIAKIEARLNRTQRLVTQLTEIQAVKRENMITQIMAIKNLTREEAETALEDFTSSTLTKKDIVKKELAKKIVEKKDLVKKYDLAKKPSLADIKLKEQINAEAALKNISVKEVIAIDLKQKKAGVA